MNPVDLFLEFVGAIVLVMCAGTALTVGVSLGLKWFPLNIRVNKFIYKIDVDGSPE